MNCPKCAAWSSVNETRTSKGTVTRRRECANGHRFTTYEAVAEGTTTNGPASAGRSLTKRHVSSRPIKLAQEPHADFTNALARVIESQQAQLDAARAAHPDDLCLGLLLMEDLDVLRQALPNGGVGGRDE